MFKIYCFPSAFYFAKLLGCPQGLELDYGELREYTHGMFGNLAEVLGPDFGPYLAHVVPPATAACTQVLARPFRGH